MILELNNNRWTCNCDIVEVLQWAESRMGQQPTHKPVKCWEGQHYRTLWTMAGGNRSCGESKTTDPVVARDREFTTDMAVDSTIMSVGTAPTLKSSPGTTLQRVTENAVTREAATESETGGWASLLSWNVKTLMILVILPIAFVAAGVVWFMAMHYIIKRCTRKDHLPQHHREEKYNNVLVSLSDVPLLQSQLTADITKQHARNEN
jgi:hypothetical protein